MTEEKKRDGSEPSYHMSEDEIRRSKRLLEKIVKSGRFSNKSDVNVCLSESMDILISVERDAKSVKIPDSVNIIQDNAFCGCQSLDEVIIPNHVTKIGDYAFSGCSSLKEIVIPDSVKWIGSGAFGPGPYIVRCFDGPPVPPEPPYFGGCESLKRVTIHGPITMIGDHVFSNCSSLEKFVIPNHVTDIGMGAFSGCSSLKEIIIPDSVIRIDSHAFSGCSSLRKIAIPKSVTRIGEGAFSHCPHISIEVDCSNEFYQSADGSLFDKTGRSLIAGQSLILKDGSCAIPDSVTEIGECAFEGCSSLSEINIPDSVTGIGVKAFSGCCSLKQVIIPDSVTSIGRWAFSECSSLEKIIIPDHLIPGMLLEPYCDFDLDLYPSFLRSSCYYYLDMLYVVPNHTKVISGTDGRIIPNERGIEQNNWDIGW